MTDKENEIPEYLRSLPNPSADDLWLRIFERFEELGDTLRSVRLETKEQAIPQRHGMSTVDIGVYWDDPNICGKVRSWLQIPYDPSRDVEYFNEVWQFALVLSQRLAPKILARELTVQTLSDWGEFNRLASFIEREHLRERPNLRHLKGAASQSLDHHRIWFSHLFMSLKQEGDRRVDTDNRVLGYLHTILERNKFPDPVFSKEWYHVILAENSDDLSASFKENKLPKKEIQRLAEQPLDDLPPIDTGSYHL